MRFQDWRKTVSNLKFADDILVATSPEELLVDDGKLEQIDSFEYLGSRITNDADCITV